MKWDSVAIIILGKIDCVIKMAAIDFIKMYNIPAELTIVKKYSTTQSILQNIDLTFEREGVLNGWPGKKSKLIILSHGTPTKCDKYYTPRNLARYLRYLGITQVGLISFKSCSIG